ncbi:MAG: methylglyoxal synthase [Dehalococcoides mccartyi]|jgi:Methylglyoxal synthase|uniref:Methylglyoxal synthase n=3 Tax=root TaxID=1 RepID=A0A0V8LXG8_9CHLR|nr:MULTISPECIES: methylglyoxal synthase [Dehalococcoides]AAW39175.1 methylglyoxal synthase, putative [Dehalococcoides mccartyi 195]AII60085.1 methylglyoxal synthase [Dehalococcoides mccartyi CG4]AQU03709.1 methylglyoxal synthase [Dehalococcoides mccartyi]AQU05010.1 methylglyoxal synthase [Dehalococcoides mccartyi]KSV16210.1 methylglyoxal synthase [Dehalococcoides mccartyi]
MEEPKITLGLIAHNNCKKDMVHLIQAYAHLMKGHHLIATKSTGELIRKHTGLPVILKESGPDGGELQLGGFVASGIIKAVIFLRDPLKRKSHEPDVTALMRVCDAHNIPLATNRATAACVLHTVLFHPDKLEDMPPKESDDDP